MYVCVHGLESQMRKRGTSISTGTGTGTSTNSSGGDRTTFADHVLVHSQQEVHGLHA